MNCIGHTALVREMLVATRVILALVFLACLPGCTANYGPESLLGTWQGSRNDLSSVTVTFFANGKINLVFIGQGGDVSTVDGDYEVDFSKSPIPLSIRGISQLSHPLHTLIEFKDIDNFRMGEFAPRWRLRPISFDPATQVWLSRQQSGEAQAD